MFDLDWVLAKENEQAEIKLKRDLDSAKQKSRSDTLSLCLQIISMQTKVILTAAIHDND